MAPKFAMGGRKISGSFAWSSVDRGTVWTSGSVIVNGLFVEQVENGCQMDKCRTVQVHKLYTAILESKLYKAIQNYFHKIEYLL
jgi:hypothetical protein